MWNLISKYLGPLATFLLVIMTVNYCNKAREAKDLANVHSGRIKTAVEIIERYEDSLENEHVVFKPNKITQEELSEFIDTSHYTLIDSLSRELKIAKRNIEDITRVKSTLEARLKGVQQGDVVVGTDKTFNWTYSPADTTLYLKGNITLNSFTYNDGKRFLGFDINPRNTYVDMWWEDKRLRINSVDKITIKNPIPRNSIKLYAKSEYRFGRNALLMGPSATVRFHNINFEYSYLYNAQAAQFESVLGVKYNPFQ